VKMISGEPLVKPVLQETPLLAALLWLAIPAVLWAGFVKNHRQLESRIHARLAEFSRQRPVGASSGLLAVPPAPAPALPEEGDLAMLKVLVPIDGSFNSLRALSHAMAEYQRHHELELHLLNVQPHLSRHVAHFVSRHDRDAWHHEQADAATASARALLTQAGVPYQMHWSV